MPRYDFKCEKCGAVDEFWQKEPVEGPRKVLHKDAETGGDCAGLSHRVWGGFGIGRVDGAGGAPGRNS